MTKTKEELDFDVRIVERNIRDGIVEKKDYEKFLGNLPDVEEKGEPLVFEDEVAAEEAAADEQGAEVSAEENQGEAGEEGEESREEGEETE